MKTHTEKKRISLHYAGIFLSPFLLLYSCATTNNNNLTTAVPEEGGINFTMITDNTDLVYGTDVTPKSLNEFTWWSSPLIALSPDGEKIAYISRKNKLNNIMVKHTKKASGSVQRTFRNNVTGLSWSPDGQYICFSEERGNRNCIYLVNAGEGSVLQQISPSQINNDYGPVFSPNCQLIYFSRADAYGYSLWSFNTKNSLFSSYSQGMNPYPVTNEENTLLCVRETENKDCEIWKINYLTGVEQVILSQTKKSFTSPRLSPDGKWIVCVGNTYNPQQKKMNLDIYVVKTDGSQLTQLTYHPGHDSSPVWSPDGKNIYFLSQRGTEKGEWNIWKMNFPL